jgi:three-Cys-motif partner protein
VSERPGRSWGYWTRAKLAILADYLPAFLTASSGKATEFVYLDAFAGEGKGTDRLTGEEFNGSSRIALEAPEAGGFTRLRYFEQVSKARELEDRFRAEYPNRDIKVYGGDCNEQIPRALDELRPYRWAPTFAFIDPDGMEFAWETLVRLAEHKRGYRAAGSAKREYKVELWLLFPTSGIIRTLSLDPTKVRLQDELRATRLYGSDGWKIIHKDRMDGVLDAQEAKDEYVNLLRWRLTHDLGYHRTHPLELKNTNGSTLYHMVFATDNDAGDKIMSDLYGRTAQQMPQMRREARDRKSGQFAFDLGIGVDAADSATYEYEPPWRPPSDDPV